MWMRSEIALVEMELDRKGNLVCLAFEQISHGTLNLNKEWDWNCDKCSMLENGICPKHLCYRLTSLGKWIEQETKWESLFCLKLLQLETWVTEEDTTVD